MKTNLDQYYKTDTEMEKQGIEFAINDKIVFRVKHFGGINSTEISKKMAQLRKPYVRQIEAGTLDPEKERQLSIRCFVDTCLMGWSGVEIDGAEVPYSPEAAYELFKKLPALFEDLVAYSSDRNNYKEVLGNS